MFVVISAINPSEGTVDLVIIAGDRVLLAFWVPRKFSERARIERIVRGRPLDKAQFVELSLVLPSIIGPVIKDKTIKELHALVGRSFEVEFELEFKPLIKE